MDSRFLELWGHFLLLAARNRQLLERFAPAAGAGSAGENPFAGWMWDPSQWLEFCRTNLPGWPAYDDLFGPGGKGGREMPGAGTAENGSNFPDWLAGAGTGFAAWQRQWREFARLFGFVPRNEFDRLERELGEVRERLREAEATIERLRGGPGRDDQRGDTTGAFFDLNQAAAAFDQLLREQNRRFAEFLGAAAKSGATETAKTAETAPPDGAVQETGAPGTTDPDAADEGNPSP